MTMKKIYPRNGQVIAALDVGSSKIACFIARFTNDEGEYQILGVGHQAARGIKNGTVMDLSEAESAIRECVHAAERIAATKIKGLALRDVIINVPGSHARSQQVDMQVEIKGHEVTDQDIRRALSRAQAQAAETSYELVHTIPASFKLDGQSGVREPRGMFGERLDVGIHLVTCQDQAIRNFSTCVERSHLDIEALCLSAYASGLACLVEDEKDLGCTVIDMGGGITSYAVFQGGEMVHAGAVPLGGRHVTSDIARGLTTSLNQAERIKTLYGNAMAASSDESDMIDVPQIGDEGREPEHVTRAVLIGVIQPRLEEICELVRARLQDAGFANLSRRVVLTGGASQMPGMRDLAQLVLDKQIRMGRPVRMPGLADSVTGPAFATTAGLLQYYAKQHGDMPTAIGLRDEAEGMWVRLKSWLVENW